MDKDWTVLCCVNGETEGNIIKGLLESEGIPSILRQEAVGKFYAFTVDGLGETKVLVPSHLKEKALQIIFSSKNSPLEDSGLNKPGEKQ